ncbi:hypothetical protein [Gordonia humi]|uniref:Uncharacterized protein n=1 Tax=Gordonia humi TaxID=686429 RepID=A0A840F5S7_9ACTN|nr:hypothetical protein [Gordonia humi]
MSLSSHAPAARPGPSPLPRRVIACLSAIPIGAVLALTGCSSDGGDSADAGPCAATSSVDTAGLRPIPIPPAEVTVLDPGAGYREVPTPRPDTGSPQEVTLTTDSQESSITPAADGEQSVQSTQEKLTTAVTARVVCDDPSNLEFTIGTPTTPDEALTPELDAIGGSAGGITVADGLNVRSLRLMPKQESGSPARSALEQSFSGALDQSVPLPTEPVGVGARWQSVRTISAAATIKRTTTVTLAERTGDILQLDVAVDETPVDSVFRIPGSAQTLTIARYSMAGSGRITVDLKRILPVGGSLTTKGARELVGDEHGVPLLQQNQYTVTWE